MKKVEKKKENQVIIVENLNIKVLIKRNIKLLLKEGLKQVELERPDGTNEVGRVGVDACEGIWRRNTLKE